MKKCLLLAVGVFLCFFFSCKKDEVKSSEKQILEISIGSFGANSKGKIDEEVKTVIFEVPSGTDITNLVPMIKVSDNASVSPAVGVAQDFTNPVNYVVTAEDGTKQIYVVKVIVLKSEEKSMLSFKLADLNPEVVGIIDDAKKIVSLTVPFNTDVTALVPTITFSKNATVTPASDVKQDFTKPVTYTVTAEDGSKQEYVVTVKVKENSEKSITAFKLAGLTPAVEGAIDEVNKTIQLSVPYGTNVKELVPTISFSKNATVTPASDVKQDFTKPVTYTVTAEDGSKQEFVVTVKVKENSTKSITAFKLAGLTPAVEGAIDEVNKKILLSVPYGTNIKELVPTISISNNAKIAPASDVQQDFSKPVTYTITAEDGSKEAYEVTVKEGLNSAKSITEFKLGNSQAAATIDEANSTITVQLPYGTDVRALVPSITLSDKATVAPASGVAQNFTTPVTYTVIAQDGTKHDYEVSVKLDKNTENIIKEFKFAGLKPAVVASIDQEARTIKLKVPFGTDLSMLVPTITISGDATIDPKSNVAVDFSQPITYTVTSQSGASRSYTVTVEVSADPSVLVISSINEKSFTIGLGEIVIKGQNLKKQGTTSYICFGDKKYKGTVNDEGTEIRAAIPTDISLGTLKVKVQVGINNLSNELDVIILENTFPSPEIISVSATDLVNGDVLEIKGANFMKAGNKVRLATNGFPKLNYVLNLVSEDETTLRFSTATVLKPGSYDLYVSSNGKETKYSVKIKLSLKPAVITSVSPLKLKAGELITVTGENFNKETLSMILINDGAHKITYVDDKHVTINASTDLTPGKYTLDIKIGATTASGAPTFKVIYSTEIEIIP